MTGKSGLWLRRCMVAVVFVVLAVLAVGKLWQPSGVAEAAQAAEKPTGDFDLKQAGTLIFQNKGGIDLQLLLPAIDHGVEVGLEPLEISIGVELPRHYYNNIVSEVRTAVHLAAIAAMQGRDVSKDLAEMHFKNRPQVSQEAVRKRILRAPQRREDLELLLQSIKRQLEQMPAQ